MYGTFVTHTYSRAEVRLFSEMSVWEILYNLYSTSIFWIISYLGAIKVIRNAMGGERV